MRKEWAKGLDPFSPLIQTDMRESKRAVALPKKKGWATELWQQMQLALLSLRQPALSYLQNARGGQVESGVLRHLPIH